MPDNKIHPYDNQALMITDLKKIWQSTPDAKITIVTANPYVVEQVKSQISASLQKNIQLLQIEEPDYSTEEAVKTRTRKN